jgi:hypothetical protein
MVVDTYATGEHGRQYTADRPNRSLPKNGPDVAQDLLVGPDDVFVQQYTPLGLQMDAPMGVHSIRRVFPVPHGILYINGVRSFNEPGEVEVVRLQVGNGGDIARNAAPFDAAAYRTVKCFCPVDWGCCEEVVMTVHGLVPNARLNWTVFGTLIQSWNSCYASAGPVEEYAAAVWGRAQRRQTNAPRRFSAAAQRLSKQLSRRTR